MYFNEKNKRKGSLFQGVFKAKHIDDNDYLLHTSAYINLNARVHKLGGETSKLSESSWSEYTKAKVNSKICNTEIILDQFKSKKEYADFCEDSLGLMWQAKNEAYELKAVILEE